MFDKIALILTIIGGINWGLIGFFQFDLVAFICGGSASAISPRHLRPSGSGRPVVHFPAVPGRGPRSRGNGPLTPALASARNRLTDGKKSTI